MSRRSVPRDELGQYSPLIPAGRSSGRDDLNSPMSTFSTHSHELKFIFEPCVGSEEDGNSYSDYSYIAPRSKPPRNSRGSGSSRTTSASSGQSCKENYPPAHHHAPTSSSSISEPLHPQVCHSNSSSDISHDPARRRTWSPSGLKLSLDYAGYYNVRGCHSNDGLDWELQRRTQHVQQMQQQLPGQQHQNNYEDVEPMPPRLAPVSGVLTEKPGRNLIRPIAFKPIHSSHSGITSPPQGNRILSDQDETMHSRDSLLQQQPALLYHQQHSSQTFNQPVNASFSAHPGDRSMSFSNDFHRSMDSPLGTSLDASRLSCHSGSGTQSMEVVVQTPSPSDSGVGELEAMLKEKDAEILTLRQVMDRNERAIFQVYEEKKNGWLRDLQEVKDEYERKLKVQQRRAYKTEQSLSMQVCKLQQEKQQLQGDLDALYTDKDTISRQCANFQHQLHDLRLQLEAVSTIHGTGVNANSRTHSDTVAEVELLRQQLKNTQEELSLKNKEVIGLRSQLHSLEAEVEKKNRDLSDKFREIVSKTEELKALRAELNQLSANEPVYCDGCTQTNHADSAVSRQENVKPSVLADKEQTIISLQDEVRNLMEQIENAESLLETERTQWLEEKNKVIRYQKQLQLNYVQMQRKNTALEAEVEQLTLELESRDLKLIAMTGEESVC